MKCMCTHNFSKPSSIPHLYGRRIQINISGEVHEATTTAVRSLLKKAAVPIMEHSSSGDPADSDSPSRGVSEPENNNDGIQEIVHPGVSSQPKPSGEPGVKQNEPLGACLQEDEQQQVTPMALQHLQLENEDQSVYSDIDGRDELGASRRRSCSHVGTDEVRLSTSNTRANAQVISDAWNTAEVEKLVELGDGGGFGDRSIFDRASQDIFQVLQMDAYPKFVAHCLRRNLALS